MNMYQDSLLEDQIKNQFSKPVIRTRVMLFKSLCVIDLLISVLISVCIVDELDGPTDCMWALNEEVLVSITGRTIVENELWKTKFRRSSIHYTWNFLVLTQVIGVVWLTHYYYCWRQVFSKEQDFRDASWKLPKVL